MPSLKHATIYLTILTLLSGCASWSKADKYAASIMIAGTTTDMISTSYVIHHGGFEHNPILGWHPSDSSIALFGIAAIGFWLLVSDFMPSKYRQITLYTVGVLSLLMSGRNFYIMQ